MKTLPPEVAIAVGLAGGMPDPYRTDVEWRRYHHHDLLDMPDELLEAERTVVAVAWAALTRALWWSPEEATLRWFGERRVAVAGAIERRQGSR